MIGSSVVVTSNQTLSAGISYEDRFNNGVNMSPTSDLGTAREYVLYIKVTNKNGVNYNQGDVLTAHFCSVPVNGLTDSTALKGVASRMEILCPAGSNETAYFSSPIKPACGEYFYIWYSHTNWADTRNVTASIAGIP